MKIQLEIWTAKIQNLVVLKCISFAEHHSQTNKKNKQYFIEQVLQNPVVITTTTISFLVVHIYFLVDIDTRTRLFS